MALYIVPTPIGNLGDITRRAVEVLAPGRFHHRRRQPLFAEAAEPPGDQKKDRQPLPPQGGDPGGKDRRPAGQPGRRPDHRFGHAGDLRPRLHPDPQGHRRGHPGHPPARADRLRPRPGRLGHRPAALPVPRLSAAPPRATCERFLKALAPLPYTLVFYESPRRLEDFLQSAAAVLGDRDFALAKELSKKHEKFVRARLDEWQAALEAGNRPGRNGRGHRRRPGGERAGSGAPLADHRRPLRLFPAALRHGQKRAEKSADEKERPKTAPAMAAEQARAIAGYAAAFAAAGGSPLPGVCAARPEKTAALARAQRLRHRPGGLLHPRDPPGLGHGRHPLFPPGPLRRTVPALPLPLQPDPHPEQAIDRPGRL